MDITPLPRAEDRAARRLRHAAERRTRARFMLPDGATATGAPSPGARSPRQIRDVALLPRGGGPRARAIARAVFAPNRVEWMSAALGDPGRGRRDGAHLRREHRRAGRVRRRAQRRARWSSSTRRRSLGARPRGVGRATRAVERDRAPRRRARRGADRSPSCASRARRCPPFAERRAQARARGRARSRDRRARATRRTPGAFERTMNAVSLDQPGMMLYTSGTSRQPEGRAAHAPQRGA